MSESPRRRHVLAVQVAVSLVAVCALMAHLLLPDFNLDAVALALVGLAVAPWLGVILESFEIGGTKVRYRQIAEQVERVEDDLERTQDSIGALDSRIERVESFAFTGAGTAPQRAKLASALAAYRRRLEEIGLEPGPVMDIHIDREQPGASYPDEDAGRFVIGAAMADETDVLLHEYTHHVLAKVAATPRDEWDPGLAVVECGLTYYLPASTTDNPVHAGWVNLLDVDPVLQHAHDAAHRAGIHWASAFWDLRTQRGPDPFDGKLVTAWQTVWREHAPDATAYVRALAATGTSDGRLDELLAGHGVDLAD